jgi:predicted membrane channel-forming protein YqfA (hemolysin III family)
VETDAALVITGVVSTFVQIVKSFGVSGKWGMAWAALFSFIGVALYAVSFEQSFERHDIWQYFTAVGVVTLGSIGVFSAIKQAPDMVTNLKGVGSNLKQSITGDGS